MVNEEPEEETVESISFSEFLESIPPNQLRVVEGLANKDTTPQRTIQYSYQLEIRHPELRLHCPSEGCSGTRFFRCRSSPQHIDHRGFKHLYLSYLCSNCQRHMKTYSLRSKLQTNGSESGECEKFGEHPAFGPPTPSRLIKLIGPDRDDFLKGRRCENQGLGVGAFIYYRRVVENQKNRIIGEIRKVAEKLGADHGALDRLDQALGETQFSKALELAKESIPQSLLINGHNPMALLHSALSEGVHAQSDSECLSVAASARVILAELSERISQALKDEEELKNALHTLLHRDAG